MSLISKLFFFSFISSKQRRVKSDNVKILKNLILMTATKKNNLHAHYCCITCIAILNYWMNGKHSYMSFAVPMSFCKSWYRLLLLLNKRHEVFEKEQSAILFIQIFLQLRDLCRKELKKVFRKEPKEVLRKEPKKVLLSPFCIKLGHLKNFVNAFNKNCDVFQHLKQFWQN